MYQARIRIGLPDRKGEVGRWSQVRVHGPSVTGVQMRARRCDVKPDPATIVPNGKAEGGVSGRRRLRESPWLLRSMGPKQIGGSAMRAEVGQTRADRREFPTAPCTRSPCDRGAQIISGRLDTVKLFIAAIQGWQEGLRRVLPRQPTEEYRRARPGSFDPDLKCDL
jgi:hypothetical protein